MLHRIARGSADPVMLGIIIIKLLLPSHPYLMTGSRAGAMRPGVDEVTGCMSVGYMGTYGSYRPKVVPRMAQHFLGLA